MDCGQRAALNRRRRQNESLTLVNTIFVGHLKSQPPPPIEEGKQVENCLVGREVEGYLVGDEV